MGSRKVGMKGVSILPVLYLCSSSSSFSCLCFSSTMVGYLSVLSHTDCTAHRNLQVTHIDQQDGTDRCTENGEDDTTNIQWHHVAYDQQY